MTKLLVVLCAGLASSSDVSWYDPQGVLTHKGDGRGDIVAWQERGGLPSSDLGHDNLPVVDMLRPVPVAIFATEGGEDYVDLPLLSREEAENRAEEFVAETNGVAGVVRGRRLDNETKTYYSTPEIAQYQLNMWTGIALIVVLLSAVLAMVNMKPEYDSLLYATFQANVSQNMNKLE